MVSLYFRSDTFNLLSVVLLFLLFVGVGGFVGWFLLVWGGCLFVVVLFVFRGSTCDGVYVPCIYSHAR